MKKQKLSLVICAIFFFGCSSDIDKVKDGILDFDKSLTIGEAIDNYKMCENVAWSSFKSDNGRDMVEARCDLTNRFLNLAENSFKNEKRRVEENFNEIAKNLLNNEKVIKEEGEKEIYNINLTADSIKNSFNEEVERELARMQRKFEHYKETFDKCTEEAKREANQAAIDSSIATCKFIMQGNYDFMVNYNDYVQEYKQASNQKLQEAVAKGNEQRKVRLQESDKKTQSKLQANKQAQANNTQTHNSNLKALQEIYNNITKDTLNLVFQFSLDKKGDGLNVEYVGLKLKEQNIDLDNSFLMQIYQKNEIRISKDKKYF